MDVGPILRFVFDKLSFGRRVRRFVPAMRAQYERIQLQDLAGLREAELLNLADELFRLTVDTAYYNVVGPLLMLVWERMFRSNLARLGIDAATVDVMHGVADLRGLNPQERLAELNHQFHALPAPGYTDNNQCWGCHGGEVPPWEDTGLPAPTIDASVEGMQPTMGSCGALVAIRGTGFGEEHLAGRDVQIRLGAPDPWQTLPIHAWTDNYIEVEIPCWQFAPGNYKIRVHTEAGNSNQRTFTLKDTPTVLAVNDNVGDTDSGPCGSWLQITGSGGFSTTRNGIAGDGYHGYTHIVDFFASSGEYTATAYRNWSDTSIEARIWNLFRDGGGGSPPYGQPDECSIDPITGQPRMTRNFVQDPAGKEDFCDSGAGNQGCEAEPTIPGCDCLSTGVYNVYVKAIYYGDDDASGNLSCGDTIFEVEKSDPVQYELTNETVVNKLNPKTIVDPMKSGEAGPPLGTRTDPNPLLRIYGANFNPTQSDGTVCLSSKGNCESTSLGLGTVLNGSSIKLWSDTLIKARVNFVNGWRGTTKWLWVEKGGFKSNCRPLAIKAPLP